jgi:hypothetical protein
MASIVSLPATIVAILGWLQRPGTARTVVVTSAATIAFVAYAVDISDRLGWVNFSETGVFTLDLVKSWGSVGAAYRMTIDSQPLLNYKRDFKLMLIVNVPYSNIDRMTDDAVEKSAMFTITGDTTTLAIPSYPAPGHLRIIIPPNYKVGDDVNILVDFNLVVIPNNSPIEQIKSLSDVERLGGKIITTHAANVQFHTRTEKKKD